MAAFGLASYDSQPSFLNQSIGDIAPGNFMARKVPEFEII